MADDPTIPAPAPAAPTVEKVVETKETTKTSGNVVTLQTAPPPPVADDTARKWLAAGVILQFVVVIAYIVWSASAHETNNAEMMILGAEIGFVTTVISYYFGSSSGSTSAHASVLNRQ